MAKIVITPYLKERIYKTFKKDSTEIFQNMKSLETNPHKGKSLTNISEFVIKELKYKKFRFYFITDGHILKFGSKEELTDLIIKFVEMSEKKNQKDAIIQVKKALEKIGFDEF